MKSERSNASTERILALLLLLLRRGEQSRDDIFRRIPAYRRGATAEAQCKMFYRDLSTLERAGIQVERREVLIDYVLYSVPVTQFERPEQVKKRDRLLQRKALQ